VEVLEARATAPRQLSDFLFAGAFVTIRPVKQLFSLCRAAFVLPSLLIVLSFELGPVPVAASAGAVGLKTVAEGFVSPLNLATLPDGSKRLVIADQTGVVRVLDQDGKLREQPYLDLRERMTKLNEGFDERGLLGLVYHPGFNPNRKLYLYYSAPRRSNLSTNWDHTARLSEFQVTPDGSKVDLRTEKVLLEIDEPQMNHNCGRLAFGPDGYLYLGVGDGGGANDNEFGHADGTGNGQDTKTLLGKILRIDVNKGSPYGIPTDNPFADGKLGRPEIYAYGLRNPWGISFDRGGSHELFAVDVGQNLFEELNIIVKGGNYGWRAREGVHGFDPKAPNEPPANPPTTDALGRPFVDPVAEYKHPPRNKIDPTAVQGISVTGGYVYRGKALPQLQGRYVFADWSRTWALPDGILLTATREGEGSSAKWTLDLLPVATPNGKIPAYIVALGEDADGELYLLTNGRNSLTGQTGKVMKLVPAE
jgi:glucose/arabinose dehydrogenase